MPRTRDLAIFVATTDNDDDRQTKLIALPLAHAHRVMKSCEKQYSPLTYIIILNEYTHVWASQNTFNRWTVWACLQIWRGTFIVKALWLRAWFTTEWVAYKCNSHILCHCHHWQAIIIEAVFYWSFKLCLNLEWQWPEDIIFANLLSARFTATTVHFKSMVSLVTIVSTASVHTSQYRSYYTLYLTH